MSREQDRQRALDLLADRALEGLDDSREAELQSLLAECPVEDEELYDAIAAELVVAELNGDAAVPPELEARLREALERTIASEPPHTSEPSREDSPVPAQVSGRPASERPTVASSRKVRWSEIVAWLGVAACLVVIASDPLRDPDPTSAPRTVAELRSSLLDEADDLVSIRWEPGPTAPERDAGFDFGDVVWSPDRQQGFMRIRGLPVNDPTLEQYQLWIFDATRDEAHPVDGGVFDVDAATGDVIVPITAKLDVRDATLFAITVEPPGGVVVSTRDRLPLLAKVEAANPRS